MPNGPALDWPELTDLCARFNTADDIFDQEDVIRSRIASMDQKRERIQRLLDAMRGRFEGWIALYQPALPGVRKVEPMISREAAEPYRDAATRCIEEALTYAWDQLGLRTDWQEAAARKLSYDVEHPRLWDQTKAGTALQALLSCQRQFLVDVIPRWSISVGRGDMRKTEGISQLQTLQIGRTGGEILDDLGGGRLRRDEGYDLGIDEDFR